VSVDQLDKTTNTGCTPGGPGARRCYRPVVFPTRTIALLTVSAFVWHLGWSATIPVPVDWDAAYYLDVARNIAEGRGAVSRSIWHLSGPELPLPLPADLHWMPLPSRVLVPGVWLAGATGAAVTTALCAALWVPVAAGLAVGAGEGRAGPHVVMAGILAGLAGGYVRFLSTPDSVALYGLLGAGALLAASRGKLWSALLACVLAALCRGDGFLLAACVALPFVLDRRWLAAGVVAASGPVAALLWYLRCLLLAGPSWLESRSRTADALHIHDLVLGRVSDPTVVDRMLGVGTAVQNALSVAIVVGVLVLPLFALVGAWRLRRRAWVLAAVGYAVLMPVVTGFLAPGVAASGTSFRSGAALFPVACALAAERCVALGRLGHVKRGYPEWLIPAALLVVVGAGASAMGLATAAARPVPAFDCPSLKAAGGPVLTGRPLELTARCDVPTVGLFVGEEAEAVRRRAQAHGARTAWLPERDVDPLVPTVTHQNALLDGWIAQSPGVYVAPADSP